MPTSHNRNTLFITLSVCFGFLTTPVTISGINVVIPSISAEFGLNAILTNWVLALFILSNCAFILPAGRLADNYGRKRIYMLGGWLLVVGALVSIVATSEFIFFVGRFVQGMAVAMIFSSGLALIVSAVPKKDRGLYLGLTSACVYVGLSIGPLIGGWLESAYGWRSCFMAIIVAIIGVNGILLATYGQDWKAAEKKAIDISGSLFLALAISGLVIGTTLINQSYAIWIFFSSVIFILIFIRLQKRRTHPLIRLDLLRKNTALLHGSLASFLMYTGNYTVPFLMALCMQYVYMMSAFEAGTIIIWQAIAMTIAALLVSKLSQIYEPRTLAFSGVTLYSIGLLTLAYKLQQNDIVGMQYALFVIGFGFGFFSAPNNTMGLSKVSDDRMGIGAGLINFARVFGNIAGSLIVLLLTAIFVGQVAFSTQTTVELLLIAKISFVTGAILAVVAIVIILKQADINPKRIDALKDKTSDLGH